jgi:DNA repair protein RadC
MEANKMTTIINVYSLRMVKESACNYNIENAVTSPEIACKMANEVFDMQDQPNEVFAILCVNTKNKVAGAHIISQGSLNSSIVHPREVFKAACLNNASGLILVHNHPSGDPAPSQEDIDTTKRLVDAGKIMGIKVLDHIIIGDSRYTSLMEKGLM